MQISNSTGLSDESRHYYVDEAGCLTLFNKRGKTIVGQEGVSKAFMLGAAWVQDVQQLEEGFQELRTHLTQDPYFSKVPSMDLSRKKTALAFHAKDDIAEVRWMVFKLLKTLPCKVFVAFRRKASLIEYTQTHKRLTGQSYPENQIYDDLTSRVFRNLLHQADCHILFSRRGKTSRQNALLQAVGRAKQRFENKYGIENEKNTVVQVAAPHEFAGLQLIDYYLWALQRLLERREDRYFDYLSENYRLIMDLDDTRQNGYGMWYRDSYPLTLASVAPL